MLTERQMLRSIDSAIESGVPDQLCWAAVATVRFLSTAESGPWFLEQLRSRQPLWLKARRRQQEAHDRLLAEGDEAAEAIKLFLEGGSVDLVEQRDVPLVEPASGEAEFEALADYLVDEDRLCELCKGAEQLAEPAPVVAVGALEFHAPPLVLMYHEGLIERPWGEPGWGAEPGLIEDSILMACAVGALRDPKRTLDVVQRLEPHLRELQGIDAWEIGASGFARLGRAGLIEPTGLGTCQASREGARIVAVHLMPAWGEAQVGYRPRIV